MRKLLSMILTSTIFLFISSCTNNNSIIGEWRMDFEMDGAYGVWTFNPNNTYVWQIYDSDDEPIGGCTYKGTYKYDGETLTTIENGEEEKIPVTIDGDTMTAISLDDDFTELVYKRM